MEKLKDEKEKDKRAKKKRKKERGDAKLSGRHSEL